MGGGGGAGSSGFGLGIQTGHAYPFIALVRRSPLFSLVRDFERCSPRRQNTPSARPCSSRVATRIPRRRGRSLRALASPRRTRPRCSIRSPARPWFSPAAASEEGSSWPGRQTKPRSLTLSTPSSPSRASVAVRSSCRVTVRHSVRSTDGWMRPWPRWRRRSESRRWLRFSRSPCLASPPVRFRPLPSIERVVTRPGRSPEPPRVREGLTLRSNRWGTER